MSIIKFSKTVASGNDFVVIENYKGNFSKLAQKLCERKYGIGADGLLVLTKSRKADFKMRIFNPDGSEAEMCGNGLRCAVVRQAHHPSGSINSPSLEPSRAGSRENHPERSRGTFSVQKMSIETKAGILGAEVKGNRVKVKMTQPKEIKLNIPLTVNNRKIKVNFIDTGVPHAVVFVEGLNKIDVKNIGEKIRFHPKFMPKGANVNFVEIVGESNIKVRTYERGVEAETLACGTGSVAAAIVSIISEKRKRKSEKQVINVYTKSGEVLKIYFTLKNNKVSGVYLEGEARIVYRGEINV